MIRFKIFYNFRLLFIILLVIKCGHPNSSADFYVNNQSDFDLYITIENSPPGEPPFLPYDPIPTKSSLKIFERGAIGANYSITPAEELEWINLYIQINDSTDYKLVYKQNPIINEKWDLIEHISGKGGTSNVWELLVENSDLNFNL